MGRTDQPDQDEVYAARMTSPSRGILWLARASAWTCAALGLSVGAHVIGGGALPSSGVAAFLVAALLWVGLLLTRHRLGPVTLIATLGATQLALHSGLTMAERSAACSPTSTGIGPHAGHDLTLMCEGSASGVATSLTHADHSTLTMSIAHLVAAVALGLALAKGEDAVWFVTGLLVPTLPTTPTLPSLRPLTFAPSQRGEATPAAPVLGGVGRRGPPVHRAPAVT